MEKSLIKNESLKQKYEITKLNCQKCNCLVDGAVESKLKIGDYAIGKLRYLDDEYNNAFVEITNMYIFDKNDVPHKLFVTKSGNANNGCSSKNQIARNEDIIKNWFGALVAINESKHFVNLIHKDKATILEAQVDKLFEADENLDALDPKSIFSDRAINSLTKQFLRENKNNKDEITYILQPRIYKTKEEMYGKHEEVEEDENVL